MSHREIVASSPTLGIDFSVPATDIEPQSGFPRNVKIIDGIISQTPGNTLYGDNAMSGAVIHHGPYVKLDGTKYMTRMSPTKTQIYNTATDHWDDITLSGVDWTVTAGTDWFDSCTFSEQEVLLIVNGVDDMQQYNGSGKCTVVAGSPPVAKFIESYAGYPVIANITDDAGDSFPFRVQWPDTGTHTSWTTGNAGFVDLTEEPSEIRGMAKLNEYLCVYKAKSIYTGRATETDAVINFGAAAAVGVGLLNNRCLVEHNGIHYFLSSEGRVCTFNAFRADHIDPKILEQIYPRLNADRLGACFARKVPRLREIWFYICLSGDSWPKEVWKLNYDTGVILVDDCTSVTSGETFLDTSAQLTWATITGTWAEQTGRWGDSSGGSGFEFELIGKSDGYSYKIDLNELNNNGAAIDQQYVSKDFIADKEEYYKQWLGCEFTAYGTSLTFSYSTDEGVTWTDVQSAPSSSTLPFTLTSVFLRYCAWFDVISPKIRIRFRNNTVDSYFYLKSFKMLFEYREAACY